MRKYIPHLLIPTYTLLGLNLRGLGINKINSSKFNLLKDFEFRIRWGSEDPFENEKIFPKGSRVFTITGLSPDTEYTISAAVFTKVAGNSSMFSREKFQKVRTKPFNEKPPAPINVKVKPLSATSIRAGISGPEPVGPSVFRTNSELVVSGSSGP